MFIKREPVAGDLSTRASLPPRPSGLSKGVALTAMLLASQASTLEDLHSMENESRYDHREHPLAQMEVPHAYTRQQSPRVLDLTSCRKRNLPDIEILEGGTAKRMIRSEHGLKVEMNPGSAVRADGRIYHCEQFHFHTGALLREGSEHAVIRKPGQQPHRYPGEIHFVHTADNGDTAVIGVFVEIGKENEDLAYLLDHAPSESEGSRFLGKRFTPLNLLPEKRVPVHYKGSLTTPPYNGPIKWMVMVDPVEVSGEQMVKLHDMIGNNARDVQEGKTPVTLDVDVRSSK
jgi:carbonic anhydrase